MRVLITGGSGALAREIVAAWGAAADDGLVLRLTSRRTPSGDAVHVDWRGADLVSGEGLPEALAGVDAIIHAASDSSHSDIVDVEGTRTLMRAAATAGVKHLVYVSIVGIDHIPTVYYRHKLAAEQVIAAGDVPYTILRATQFHTFVDARLRKLASAPFVMPVPTAFRFQTADTREVAAHLLDVVAALPQFGILEFGGPQVMRFGEMAALWRRAAKVSKPVLPVFLFGAFARGLREGRNTVTNGAHGTMTWQQWLAIRYPAQAS